jgi:hypothetical protein
VWLEWAIGFPFHTKRKEPFGREKNWELNDFFSKHIFELNIYFKVSLSFLTYIILSVWLSSSMDTIPCGKNHWCKTKELIPTNYQLWEMIFISRWCSTPTDNFHPSSIMVDHWKNGSRLDKTFVLDGIFFINYLKNSNFFKVVATFLT